MSKKFKALFNELYRSLAWTNEEYKRGEDIDFEGASLKNVNIPSSGNPVDAADSTGTVVDDDLELLRAGTNLAYTVNSDGDVTLDATDTNTDTQNDLKDQISHSIAITSLADTDYVDVPVRVPTGKTAKVWMWGARTDAQTTPTGLTVGLYDHGAAAYVTSANTAHATGSPITSISGAADAALRLENTSGGSLNAGAVFGVTIE